MIRPEAALKIKRVEHDRAKIKRSMTRGGRWPASACPPWGIFAEGGKQHDGICTGGPFAGGHRVADHDLYLAGLRAVCPGGGGLGGRAPVYL